MKLVATGKRIDGFKWFGQRMKKFFKRNKKFSGLFGIKDNQK
jgi:hypothetical protein